MDIINCCCLGLFNLQRKCFARAISSSFFLKNPPRKSDYRGVCVPSWIIICKVFCPFGAPSPSPIKHIEKLPVQAWNPIATCFWKVRRFLWEFIPIPLLLKTTLSQMARQFTWLSGKRSRTSCLLSKESLTRKSDLFKRHREGLNIIFSRRSCKSRVLLL